MKIDTRYRIYTEDVNRETIIRYAQELFESFSLATQTGVWQSKAEPSLYIEIYGDYSLNGTVRLLAQKIKTANNQEAVLITRETVSGELY